MEYVGGIYFLNLDKDTYFYAQYVSLSLMCSQLNQTKLFRFMYE